MKKKTFNKIFSLEKQKLKLQGGHLTPVSTATVKTDKR